MSNLEKIPTELRVRRQWVLWKYLGKDGENRKTPFQPSGKTAKPNDSATWHDFDDVTPKMANYEGIGFMFSSADPYVGVDLDGCRDPETGGIEQWAKDIINQANTYTEVSPSQTGVKLFGTGNWPHGGKQYKLKDDGKKRPKERQIEVYSTGRYFATTTQRLAGVSPGINDIQQVLDTIYAEYGQPVATTQDVYECNQSEAEVVERVLKYVEWMDPAVSGQKGHSQTYAVACRAVIDFGLSEGDAMQVLRQYNQNKCEPKWSEKELLHKVRDAAKEPGERNKLRNAKPEDWDRVSLSSDGQPRQRQQPAKPSKRLRMDQLVADKIKRLAEHGDDPTVPTGIGKLDRLLGGGFHYGQLVSLCGLPSHLKSGFCQQMGHHITTVAKLPFGFISLEMDPAALAERTIQYASDTPKERWAMLTERLEEDTKKHFADAAPFEIVEGVSTLEEVEQSALELIESGTKVIAVDYAQMVLTGGRDDPNISMRKVSDSLKRIAKDNGAVIIALAQLRKSIEERKPLIPRLTDIEYGPKMGQNSDVCIFCVWPHRIDPKNPANEYQLFIEKNRNGQAKQVVNCRLEASRLRITEKTPEHTPPQDTKVLQYEKPGAIMFQDGELNGFDDADMDLFARGNQ